MIPTRRRLLSSASLALAALLAGCTTTVPPPAPRLVVLLVVDGLPQRQVTAYRDQLAPDGLARFLDRGAWFSDAHHGHAFTVTAAGHAAVSTGAYPQRTGIIGNDWRDIRTGEGVYNTGDFAHRYIGHATQPLDGTSPRNLQAETVGDVMKRADARTKVVAVSGKDRGAILTAGHRGTAYMYMGSTGRFASSTYYMQQHPAWVEAFNAARPADAFFKQEWKPLLPDAAYARSLPDNQPWFGPPGGRLPMTMGVAADDAPGPNYYASLLRSPFADALTLSFAGAAVAGEQLGRDEVPDLLAISLSAHDYINHQWSAESRLSHDHLLQLDRMLADFFRHLDDTVGRDRYLAVLSADHGFMPAPEHLAAQGIASGRVSGSQLLARLNGELQRRFGVDRLVPFLSASAIVLDREAIAGARLDADVVAEAARAAVLAEPGIEAAYTRRELTSGSRAGAPHFEAMRRSWHAERSGDVQYTMKPNWMFGSSGATHGSAQRYDTHVPVMLWGPAWVRAGEVKQRVEVVDIAPTLAHLLRLPAPSAAQGRVLPLP